MYSPSRFVQISVVQLLFAYGLFCKNVTTQEPLLIKWCDKTTEKNGFTWFKIEKGKQVKVSVSFKFLHNSNKQFITNLHEFDACDWGFSGTIAPFTIPISYCIVAVSQRLYGPVFHLPLNFCFKLDLLHGRKSTLTHVCVSKHRVHFLYEIFQLGKLIFAN